MQQLNHWAVIVSSPSIGLSNIMMRGAVTIASTGAPVQTLPLVHACKTLGKSLVIPLLSGPLCRNSYIPPPL